MRRKTVRAPSSDWRFALVFILICEGVGALGGLATASSVQSWYPTLVKPVFTPPSWIFAPVWTLLYALMGLAAYRVWQMGAQRPQVRFALLLFALQLILNLKWSLVFFGLHNLGGALLVVLLLEALIAATTYKFWAIDKSAAYLMVPYLIWTGFATLLNLSLWRLNLGA